MRKDVFESFPSKMKSVVPILILFFLSYSMAAQGPMRLTAESSVAIAIKGNKELVAARFLVQEAEGRARGAGRLPNPELETEVAVGQDFEGRVMAGVLQRFPLTSRLRLERELSDWDVRIAGLEVGEKEWQLVVATRKAFYELVAAREAVAVSGRQADLAAAFTKSLAEGVDAGFRSKLDLQQAKLSESILHAKVEALRVLEVEASARLGECLGLAADAAFEVNESLALPSSIPEARTAGKRADLELAELLLRSGETSVSLSHASRWEDVGVGLFIEGERFRDEPTGIEPEALAGVKFQIPLPLWQNGSGKVAEKIASRDRLNARCESLRFHVQNQVLLKHRILALRFRSAAQYGENVLSAAREHIRESEAAYARGELDIQAVFRARERLGEIEFADIEARKSYFLAYADWMGALGGSNL
jgi:cobalt-zinc-cadmium efflux system outer membrane protein